MFTLAFLPAFSRRSGRAAILSRFFAAAEKPRGRRGVIITEPSRTESAGKNAIVNWPLVLIGRIKTFAYTPCLSQPFHWQDVKNREPCVPEISLHYLVSWPLLPSLVL